MDLTQEEKELLLKDLCARLSYGVVCTDSRHSDSKITEIDTVSEVVYFYDIDEYVEIKNCKPYLRPMSSMTEEELSQYKCMNDALDENYEVHIDNAYPAFDWLNANHFDYRGLIEKGLAIEAPEEMYDLKKK